MTRATQSSFCSLHFGTLSLQLPADAAVSQTSPLSLLVQAGGVLARDKAEREPGEAEFGDLISVMCTAVIVSWSNMYPDRVAWEEEATAAQAAQPSGSWMQLRVYLRPT